MFEYRIWPDYTIQDADDYPHENVSDDYIYLWADSEEEAIVLYKEIYG
jgi:hypothetical protein